MSAASKLHPSLRGHPKVVSMEETDIRALDGKRLPMRPDVVVIDVSFISLKAVLPVALSLARGADAPAGADQAAIRGGAKAFKKGIVRDAAVHRQVCDDIAAFAASLGCSDISGVPVLDHRRRRQHRILPRRARVAERLVIDHVGHRGDGVALIAGERNVYVPYTLGGETVEVEAVAGHPDRRRLLARRARKPRARSRRSARISASAAAAPIQHWEPDAYRAWKRAHRGRNAARRPASTAPVDAADRRAWRRPPAHRPLHARRGTHDVLEVGFAAAVRTTSCRSIAARSSIPA